MKGHVVLKDDNDNIIFDGYNDVHPGNIARSIARGLANESNYWINSIRFGNLGTFENEDRIIHRSPNDGIDPDYSGWQSDLYNEIYIEYIDDSSGIVSYGNLADSSKDPLSFEHSLEGPGVVSIDEDGKSKVVINCCLNMNEPSNQMIDGSVFKFDEIALYTGLEYSLWAGYQLVNVSNDFKSEDTGLLNDTEYTFDLMDGDRLVNVTFKTPKIGTGIDGKISYYDLLIILNNSFDDIYVDIVAYLNNIITPIKI